MQMRILFWIALAAFAIDQISKIVIVRGLDLASIQTIEILPPFLTFRYGENRGINFGLFDGNSDATRWVLVGISVFVVAAVFFWAWRARGNRLIQVCAGLLIGGALGNVFDRLLYGHVLDFLNMSCCGIENPFVFNIADVFIFLGAVGLVLYDPAKAGEKAP